MIAIGLVAAFLGTQTTARKPEILGVADILPDRVIAWGASGVRKPALEQELTGYMRNQSLRFTFRKKNRYLIVSLDPMSGVNTYIRSEPNFDLMGDMLFSDDKRRLDWYHMDAEPDSKTVDFTISTSVPSGEYLSVEIEKAAKVTLGTHEYIFGSFEKRPGIATKDSWVALAQGPEPGLMWPWFGEAFDRANVPIKYVNATLGYDSGIKGLRLRVDHDPREISIVKFMRYDVATQKVEKYPLDPRN